MIKWNEGEALASPMTRNFEQSASVTTDKMVQVDLSATEISREEALRKRGLLGPLFHEAPRARVSESVSKFFARASLRVWAPVVGKGLGTIGMLSCVALLGFHSRTEDTYGPVVSAETTFDSKSLGDSPSIDVSTKEIAEGQDAASPAECPVPPPCADGAASAVVKEAGITADGRIILNEASVDELTRLPGVGQARAEAIVALRERLKGFRKVSDLLRIRGIGWRTLQKMKEKIVLDRPAPEPPDTEKPDSPPHGAPAPEPKPQAKQQEKGDRLGEKG